MICLLSLIIFSLMFSTSWISFLSGLFLSSVMSLFFLNCGFSSSLDLIFSTTSVSSLLIMLSCVLCFLCLISSWEYKSSSRFSVSILVLCLSLILAFSSSNLLSFYIFFEISLIPTLILIIGWGYQPERLQAGSYMMIYTVCASLPLLAVILYFGGTLSSLELKLMNLSSGPMSGVILLGVLGAFLVKLPMYGVHLWLPKAHVEAPLAGSMILAGILLKLGGFGIFQMKESLNLYNSHFVTFIVSLAMWGGFLASLICMRQMDVKSFVAYSSVGHMSIVIAGLLLDSAWGVYGAIVTMMAHGFSSSAMFCLAYLTYKKSNTRNIPYMKGMLQSYPSLSLWWFIFCCVNMACPPSLNLLGELCVVPVLWSSALSLALVMGFMVFFSAAYNMLLYSSINHGTFSHYFLAGESPKSPMLLSLLGHILPLVLVLNSGLFNFD